MPFRIISARPSTAARARAGGWLGIAVLLLALPGSATASSDAVDAPPPRPPAEAAPNIDLDRLLRLPEGFGTEVVRHRGATYEQWRGRFQDARERVDGARLKLARLEAELDRVAVGSGSWQVAAPGAANPEASPLNLRLRQDVKDQRVEINEAQRALRSLDVEADLALVPATWRE